MLIRRRTAAHEGSGASGREGRQRCRYNSNVRLYDSIDKRISHNAISRKVESSSNERGVQFAKEGLLMGEKEWHVETC